MKRAVFAALLSLVLAGVARAQDAEEAKRAAVLEEARQHVAKAKVHYDLGEFKEAADEYIIVYRLRPIPALLFNIAQAYRQGGMYDKARQFYRSYLRASPDAKNRGSIEQSIKEMDELLAKEKKTRDAPPMGVKEPAEASLPLIPEKPGSKPPPMPSAPGPEKAPPPVVTAKETLPLPAPSKPPELAQAKPDEAAPAKPPQKMARATPPPAEPQGAMPATAKPPAPVASTSTVPSPSPKVEEEGG